MNQSRDRRYLRDSHLTEKKDAMKTVQFHRFGPPEVPRRSSMATRYPCERVDLASSTPRATDSSAQSI